MAKRRMIDPEIWTDERFVSLDPLARLLFIGMWHFACDNGHLDDRALQLRMRVLPADSCNVAELLDSVVASGMVLRKDGYLKIPNLPRRQPLDLRFLVFCDHCDEDPETHYKREDKKPGRGSHASVTRASQEVPSSARRRGDGDGDGDGDGYRAHSAAPRKRGSRIPDDFAVTDDLRSWARDKGLDHLDLDGITESFFDYWRGQPGQKGVKLDWEGTWRNWVRREGKSATTHPSRFEQKVDPMWKGVL